MQLVLLTQLARRSINVEVVRTLPSEIWLGVCCTCYCLHYSHAVMLCIGLAGARGSAPSPGFGFCWSSQHRQQQQGCPRAGALAHTPDEGMNSANAPHEYQPAWGAKAMPNQLAQGLTAVWFGFATFWGVGPSTSWHWLNKMLTFVMNSSLKVNYPKSGTTSNAFDILESLKINKHWS